VVNQHGSLRRAYEYFLERALEPSVVEDETIEYGPGEIPGIQSWVSFKSGTIQMELNAFRDMIAAISACISLLVGARPCAGAGIQRFRPGQG
jgi:hypothetical protein